MRGMYVLGKIQCPSCGIEQECLVRVYRWNYVSAEADEKAVVVRTYECAVCGTVVRARDIGMSKNGKGYAKTHEHSPKAETSHA